MNTASQMTSDLQALVTGSLAASLYAAPHLNVDVSVLTDERGNYLPEFLVTGRESGTQVRVITETVKL